MRFVMKSLIGAMCGAAVLAFGVAAAAEHSVSYPGFTVLQENARIPSLTPLHGFVTLNDHSIFIRTGHRQGYIAEINGNCARGVVYDWTIGVDSASGGDIDHFSRVHINGRTCAINTLTKVDREEGLPMPQSQYAH